MLKEKEIIEVIDQGVIARNSPIPGPSKSLIKNLKENPLILKSMQKRENERKAMEAMRNNTIV